MRFRPVYALLGLCLIVFTTGCCHDRWCCHRPIFPIFPRCRAQCAPDCGCSNPCGYPPTESVPPPAYGPFAPH
jgi:hypothetical protein